jgi:hypothetical protein
MTSSITIIGKLKYDEGTLNTSSFTLVAPVSALFEFGANKEINGNVRRTGWQNGVAVIFNQPNMLVTTSSGTAPSDITVTMIPNGDPTDNEREVKRKFNFIPSGGSGFVTSISFPYSDAELNTNTENNLVPWLRSLAPVEWNSRTSTVLRNTGTNVVSISNINTIDLANEWKLADPNYTFNISAHLRGAWVNPSMSNAINSVLPLTQPYGAAPFLYTGTESVTAGFFATHTNIVDWVLVQFRKPSTGLPVNATEATQVGTKAGFILQDGSIVDLDGTSPMTIALQKQGTGFLVIRHRNHLAVMSNALLSNATGSYSNDFRVLANAYQNPNISNQALTLLPGSVYYGLWPGNANGDQLVNATDLTQVKTKVNLASTGYATEDVNMNGGVNGSDLYLTKKGANLLINTSSSRQAPTHLINSHVPQ